MSGRAWRWRFLLAFLILSSPLGAQEPTVPESAAVPRRLPGLEAEGGILLPNQWSLRPAGQQIKLGDFPVNIALHPTDPWAAVLHAGFGEHEVAIVDLKRRRVVSHASLPQT